MTALRKKGFILVLLLIMAASGCIIPNEKAGTGLSSSGISGDGGNNDADDDGDQTESLSLTAINCAPTQAPDTSGCNVRGRITESRPTFTWSTVPNASTYTLFVINDDTGATVDSKSELTATSYRPASAYPPNAQLRWKVKGKNNCGSGPYSPYVYFFIDNGGLPCPPVQAPNVSGCNVRGTITDDRPTFTWGTAPGATSYTLYVLNAQSGAEVLRAANIAGTATSYRPRNALPRGIDLKWKMKGESACGAGPYCAPVNFKIETSGPCPPTAAPDTSGCNVRGSITTRRPAFSWRAVPGAQSYTLYVLRVDNEAQVVRAVNIKGTSYTPSGDLPVRTDLRWKVKGESTCGAGPYSPSVMFRINTFTLTVDSVDANGEHHTTSYPNCTTDKAESISTVSSYTVGSPPYYTRTMNFWRWHIVSGNAVIENPQSSSTKMKNITSNTYVRAEYN